MQITAILIPVRRATLKIVDFCFYILAAAAAGLAKLQWRVGPENLPRSFRAWNACGVLPVPCHYYQPVFDPDALPKSVWTRESSLPGIDLRINRQLDLISQFRYEDELREFPLHGDPNNGFYHLNRMFGPGDAEALYGIIRHLKPRKMIEIGSGYSTLLAKAALDRNRAEGHDSEHICIEPYPEPWLETLQLTRVLRKPVETIEPAFFQQLGADDILFIDSSHVVRIGGDVQYEYLEILPRLQPGVFVHAHDIFLPFEYPLSWVRDKKWFWTEQHFLQAFLAFNSAFEVVLALSYLHAHQSEALARAAPIYAKYPSSKPGSFWMRRKLE
jgi:predicted O-methyltransferase YrrM